MFHVIESFLIGNLTKNKKIKTMVPGVQDYEINSVNIIFQSKNRIDEDYPEIG